MRPVSKPWAARKPWETAVPVAQANRQRANRWGRRKALPMTRIARGFPTYPPVGLPDRLPDLYGSLSALLGIIHISAIEDWANPEFGPD